ncbi:MAG: DUF2232 domain-containing protein [Deltaproteobacteria bacterium]|nr:MAG: DUF2232 domain-containing protein [Deltaproteobacteria bacterium]
MWAALLMNGLITVVLTLLLYTSGFFVIFTPLPLAYLFVKRGKVVAGVVAVLTFLALVLLYQVPFKLTMMPMTAFEPALEAKQVTVLGSIYLFYFLWIGFNLGVTSRQKWDVEKTFLYLVAAAILVPGLVMILAFQNAGWSFLEEMRLSFSTVVDRMVSVQKDAGMSGEEVYFLQKYKDDIVKDAINLMPSLWVGFLIVALSVNISFLRRLCLQERLLGLIFPAWVEFPFWRLKEGLVWAPIAVAALYFGNIYLFQKDIIEVVCLNALIVFAVIYFLQGLAITSFFLRVKLGPNSMLRLALYFLIFLFIQFFGVIILALGIFDFWFDFRKLKKQKQ